MNHSKKMKLFQFPFIFLIFYSLQVSGQSNSTLDSLIGELNKASQDTTKVNLLNNIAFEIGYYRNQPAIDTAKLSLNLARKIHFEKGISRSKSMLGKLFCEKGEMDSAMYYLTDALKDFHKNKDTLSVYHVLRDISNIYLETMNFDQAKNYYDTVLLLATQLDDPKLIGNSYNGLASFYIQKSKAMEDSLSGMNELTKALPCLDEAIAQFEKANYERGKILCIGNMAIVNYNLANYEKSLEYNFEALDYFEKNDYVYYQAISYNEIAGTYLKMGKYVKSREYALKFLNLSDQVNSYVDMRNCYGNLMHVEKETGNYKKALKYQELYNKYENLVINEESQNKINELEIEYQSYQKEKEIQALNAENRLKKEEIAKQRTTLIASFIVIFLVLVICIILYYFYTNKKGDNRKLNENHVKIIEQNQLLVQKNKMIKRQNERIKNQNERLKRLYEEHRNMMLAVVHDLQSPFNKIKGLSNVLQINGNLTSEQKEINDKIEEVADMGRQIISELTNASYYESDEVKANKQPVFLSQLIRKIHREHEPYATKKDISLVYKENEKDLVVNTDTEFITRILDNLISNAIKYSPPRKSIYLSSWQKDENFFIEVKDQGPGISDEDRQKMFKKFQKLSAQPTGGENSTGLGLSIVKTLTEKLGGEIHVDSMLGKGTSFVISFPISNYFKNEVEVD